MKKALKILICSVLFVVMIMSVAACNVGTQNDLQGKIDDLQSQIEELEGRLEEMEDQLGERDATIEDLNDQLSELEELKERLAEMEDQIGERDATIEDLNDQLSELEELKERLAELEEQIGERDATIEDLNDQLNELEELKERLAEMEDQIGERDATIEDLNDQIANLKEQIEQLQKELENKQDYVLKISADKQVYRIGEEIYIDITLENRSGADVEIAYYLLFIPESPTGQFPEYEQSPVTTKKVFANGEIIHSTRRLGGCFPIGQHELKYKAIFYLAWEMTEFGWETTSSDVVVHSNTIEFSVEYNKEESVGTFYTVQEAYNNGWLTQADLMSIAYYHNGGRRYNEVIMSEDYEPLPKTPEVLSEETQLKIKSTAAKDYRENYNIMDAEADGFTITEYCGTYGDCVAVMMRDEYSGEAGIDWTDSIAGVNINYGGGKTIKIWREDKGEKEEPVGSFYTLQEAYNNGWLTQADLMSIAYYYNGGRWGNEEIMSEDYEPLPKTPEVLSEETQLKIKSTAANNYREHLNDVEVEGFTITQYCGTYGNCVAVMMRDIYTESAAVIWIDSIAGVNIYYNDGRAIKIWREDKGEEEEPVGSFYTLQEAYDNGYLTKTDLESIAHYLNEEIGYPEALDSKIEKAIKETAAYDMRNREIEPLSEATADGFTIVAFYGVYSDSYVVRMRNDYDNLPTDVPSYWEEIGGVQFHFTGYDRVTVWIENENAI